MTDIREQAARAAWAKWSFYDINPEEDRDCNGGIIPSTAFEAGYLAGYEAAKADLTEARNAEPRWRDHGNG